MLPLLRVAPEYASVRWAIDSPTPGVVLLDVALEGRAPSASPLHWRVGDWTKPPLDVSINGDGQLVGFQFVLQDERVRTGESSVLPDPQNGVPIFDVDEWSPDRYADEILRVTATPLPGGELALELGDRRPVMLACRPGPFEVPILRLSKTAVAEIEGGWGAIWPYP